MKMTYTIKPLEFVERGKGYYVAEGSDRNYCLDKQLVDVYDLCFEFDHGYELFTTATKDVAIAAANDHHRKQIEKFLLPVE